MEKNFFQLNHKSHCLKYTKQNLDKSEEFWNMFKTDETVTELFAHNHARYI